MERSFIKRLWASYRPILFLIIVICIVVGAFGFAIWMSNRANSKAQKYNDKEYVVTAQDMVNGQTATFKVTRVFAILGGELDFYGVLSIDPVGPGCKKGDTTIDGNGTVTINWNCPDGSSPTQRISELRIPMQNNEWDTIIAYPYFVEQK